MKSPLFLLFFLVSYLSVAQSDINMIGSGPASPTRYTGCTSSTFNDDGGNGNYSDNFNGVAIFCPIVTTDRMILDFVQMDVAVNDVLTIYDGDSTAAPLLATITNTNVSPGAFQASAGNPTGCLTVQFVSNGSGNAAGWRAARRCFDPCQSIVTNITTTPPIDADGILRICQGDTVTFDGQATFGTDGTGATYEWDLDNGGRFNPGQVQTETYTMTGIYQTKFKVTDASGCSDRDEIDLIVQVSSDPDFTGTTAADTQLCFGESTTLTGVVATQEFITPVSPPVTGQTFLPDGNGVSYITCIDVDLFDPGTVITSATDIVDIFLNMEHSYLGDLQITITAPNGSEVDLHQYPSGDGTSLGIPIDDESNTNAGTGFDYVFTETAAQTWTQYDNANPGADTIPAGDYLPVDPYSTFIGSPINGQWCITITDNLGLDNGYIFFWGLNFNPAIIPSDLSFTPVVVNEAWQASPDITNTSGNTVTVVPSMVGQNCYTYEMTDNHGCTYTEQVCVDVIPEILAATPNDIIVCNTSGAITVDLTQNDAVILNGLPAADYMVTYYTSQTDAENGIGAINNPAAYISMPIQTIYYRLEFANSGCFSIGDFVIETVDVPIAVIPTALEACDDGSGNATVDVSLADAQVTTGQAGSTVVYYLNQTDADNQLNGITGDFTYAANTTLIVRVDNDNTGCFSFTTLDLVFNALPTPSLLNQYILCLDENNNLLNGPVTLDTGLNDTEYSYEWTLNGALIPASTASIDVAEGGDYQVTTTRISTGCSFSITTNVRVSRVPEVYDVDITTDPFDRDHQVIVSAEGPDLYWYRLDDGPYVNNGTFNDVTPGAHTVTIAERSGCGEIVVDIFVFGYPDYFTPNADGIHDTWNIIGGDRLPGTTLYIFDRYGKLIKQIDVDGPGWDGTYNGQPMPSSDYWFKIEYAFDGEQREASGHFAMKR